MDYTVLLVLWLNGLLMLGLERSKLANRSLKDQIGFIFIVNLPLLLYFNLVYLEKTGKSILF